MSSPSFTTTAVLGLAALSGAAAAQAEVTYAHPGVPAHAWTLSEAVPDPSTALRVTVAVRQPEEGKAALRKEILERSDPDSPLFSQWLTKDEVDDLIRPEPAAVQAVTQWLEQAGATDLDRTTAGDFVR